MAVQQVEIVRPEKSGSTSFAEIVGQFVALLFAGALVMWLAPATILHLHPGYMTSVITVAVTRILFTDPAAYFSWTRNRRWS